MRTIKHPPMFNDRRKRHCPEQVPADGCRRKGGERRKNGARSANDQWYLQTNYLDNQA